MRRRQEAIARILIVLMVWSSLATCALAQEVQREPYHNPFLRAAQSLVIPGWGQWSNGNGGRAAMWFFDSVFALMWATKYVSFGGSENSIQFWRTAGWIAYGLNASVSSYYAYRTARDLNRENGYELDAFDGALWRERDTDTRVTLISFDF